MFSRVVFLAAFALFFIGCGQDDSGGPGPISGDYYPMTVGNYWEYVETYGTGAPEITLSREVTGTETVDFGGELGERTVFTIDKIPDFNSDKWRTYYIEDDGGVVTRLRQISYDTDGSLIKTRNYVPGLFKFDRTRVTKGETWNESFTRYTFDEEGNPTGELAYQYTFTIDELHEEVTVPAGTFDCIVITREILETATIAYEIETSYYASGVGKVKERSEGGDFGNKTEELTTYSVGGLD